MKCLVYTTNKYTNDIKKKQNKHDSWFTNINTIIKQMIVQNQHSSWYNMDSPKIQDCGGVVPDNKKDTQLECVYFMKIVGVCNLKHAKKIAF